MPILPSMRCRPVSLAGVLAAGLRLRRLPFLFAGEAALEVLAWAAGLAAD